MKHLILFLVSLVLFTVQGWAIPLDASITYSFEKINSTKEWNGVELYENDYISTNFNPKENSNQLRVVEEIAGAIRFASWIYEIFNYFNSNYSEYMDFTFGRQNTTAIFGVDTVFYLTAMNGKIKNPIDIVMSSQNENVFDFENAKIFPEEVTSTDWIKSFRIGFHPSAPGQYDAYFKITGSQNVFDWYLLHCDVVEKYPEKSIHISPSTLLHFVDQVDMTETKQLRVTAKGLSSSLSIEIQDSNSEYPGGSKMYSIVGPKTITPSQAEDGAIVTIKYSPTSSGIHDAKVIISGDGLSESVFLYGDAIGSRITVSDNSLFFTKAETKRIKVTGIELTGNPLLIELKDESGMFTVDPTYIPIDQASQGATVFVAYHPTVPGTHKAKITISGGGTLLSKTVNLTGTIEEPSLTVTPSAISFPNETVGKSVTQTFKITGTNLLGSLSLDVSTTGNKGYFKINKNEISASQASNGSTVTVTYTPTEAGSISGQITISGGGAETKKVSLSGSAVKREITINNESLNFETVYKGNEKKKTFTVKGTNLNGNLTLNLSGATGMYTISPSTITPAQAASGKTVTVTYKPTSIGTHNETITISGGDAESKKVSLKGKCAIPSITVSNSSLDCGTVVKGKSANKSFTVSGANLTSNLYLKSSNTNFSISPSTITPSQAAAGKTVTVTYKPTAAGSHSATITIEGSSATSKTVNVKGKCVIPTITTSVTKLSFGTVGKGGSKPLTFTVSGANLTGNITLSSSNSNFTISPSTITPSQAAAGKTVTVTYKPTATGSHSATITIGGGSASSKIVNLTGTCVLPTITTSVSKLLFGSVVKGTSKPLTFTVTGSYLTGNITLSSSNSNFTISPSTITPSQAAAGKTVTVTYKPTATGSHSATLTISGGGATSKSVSLSGTSVLPTITLSRSSLNFSAADNQSFKVTGTYLTGNLSLSLTGTGARYFNLRTTSITPSQATSGVYVVVDCSPTATLQNASAQVVISGGGAASKTLNLSYSKNQPVMINSISPDVETDVNEILLDSKIFTEGQAIIIESPEEQKAIISDITGHAWTVNLQTGRNEIPINASGIYIVRIREKSTKLMLR